MIETIASLSHPQTLVLLSFDDKPPPLTNTRYEIAMNEKLRARKYLSAVVYTASMTWRKLEENSKDNDSNDVVTSRGYIEDLTDIYRNGYGSLSLPRPSIDVSSKYMMLLDHSYQDSKREDGMEIINATPDDSKQYSLSKTKEDKHIDYPLMPPIPPPFKLSHPQQVEEEKGLHHIVAYFQPTAVNTCCRCNKRFFLIKALNLSTSCRFHKGFVFFYLDFLL